MIIGWGGTIRFHIPLNNKPQNNKHVLVLNDDAIAKLLHNPSATAG